MFSYVDLEKRVRPDHSLRVIRTLANDALGSLLAEFNALYAPDGRASVPPERLLQAFYTIRASGHAERLAALHLLEPHADRTNKITVGGDKGYEAQDFVGELREINVTPHLAQNLRGRRSAIDGRTTRHRDYDGSPRIRKRIEEAFGRAKTVAGLRKAGHRGLPKLLADSASQMQQPCGIMG